jgi:ankyrin repeat protein
MLSKTKLLAKPFIKNLPVSSRSLCLRQFSVFEQKKVLKPEEQKHHDKLLRDAITENNSDFAECLIKRGANPDNISCDYPLHWRFETASDIQVSPLSHIIQKIIHDKDKKCPELHSMFKLILKHSEKALNQESTTYLETPLHFAARTLDKELIMPLLKKGADANKENWLGYTPLHYYNVGKTQFKKDKQDPEVLETFTDNMITFSAKKY